MAWRAATVASTAWLLIAVVVAAARPWRDRRAHERLEQLRDLAAEPDRALVHVKTAIWCTAAGEHAVVLNVATGVLHRVWLPETSVPIGAFAVLERTEHGARVVASVDSRVVEAAHRHERRHPDVQTTTNLCPTLAPVHRTESDDAATLIDEVEEFLRHT